MWRENIPSRKSTKGIQVKRWYDKNEILNNIEKRQLLFTATNRRPERFFFPLDSYLWFGGRQSTVTMVFTRWPREDSFPVSGALGGKCRRLSCFCNIILLQI